MNKTDIKYHLMYGALYALSLLPMRPLYCLSDAIAFVLRRVLKYRHKVIDANLRSCFPELTDAQRTDIKNEFYRHLADTIVESVKLLHISDKELDRRIEVVNPGLIDEIAATGSPVILFLAHYCNWEWVPDISRFYTSRLKSYHVYKRMHDEASDRLFMKLRSRFNSTGIEQHSVARDVLRMKREGIQFIIGFISDHRSNMQKSDRCVHFLNHRTPIIDIGEALGKRCGAQIIYLDVSKPRRGHYRMEFKRITPRPDSTDTMPYTAEYFRMLEATIRRQPPYWLWSHRRWV